MYKKYNIKTLILIDQLTVLANALRDNKITLKT
jgi:hypothetical protein